MCQTYDMQNKEWKENRNKNKTIKQIRKRRGRKCRENCCLNRKNYRNKKE